MPAAEAQDESDNTLRSPPSIANLDILPVCTRVFKRNSTIRDYMGVSDVRGPQNPLGDNPRPLTGGGFT